jgi:hypothetical protein
MYNLNNNERKNNSIVIAAVATKTANGEKKSRRT